VLSYGVLGPLRVTHAGLPVPVGAKKQRTVLALLLARANRAVGLDDLVDEVWSHDPPVSTVANVRTYAANLRRAFAACGEPDALTRSGDGYQLTVGMAACDALAFDELRRRADDERGRGDLHGCVRTLEEATALWRGPALSGVAAGANLRPYRAALDESRLAALEELAAARIEVGAFTAAVPRTATPVTTPRPAVRGGGPRRSWTTSVMPTPKRCVHGSPACPDDSSCTRGPVGPFAHPRCERRLAVNLADGHPRAR